MLPHIQVCSIAWVGRATYRISPVWGCELSRSGDLPQTSSHTSLIPGPEQPFCILQQSTGMPFSTIFCIAPLPARSSVISSQPPPVTSLQTLRRSSQGGSGSKIKYDRPSHTESLSNSARTSLHRFYRVSSIAATSTARLLTGRRCRLPSSF